MKALLLTDVCKFEYTDVPTPEPKAGEVQINIKACSICNSDVHGYDGASGRRQPSLVAVEVMPEITNDTSVELRDDDYEMQVYRSSGAGGQKVNKTSSAVRLIHKATGIVVSSQVERSHFQNLENCKQMLRAKLAEIKEREHLEKISDIKGVQMKIDFGSAIRSYVFMPYTLAKDTRTGFENGNIQNVMDGDIDGFINAYLAMKANQ